MNNPKLETIPECIADLPNFLFMNLKGSDNVEVPSKIREKGVELQKNLWDFEPEI
jgi:hypothetical protein